MDLFPKLKENPRWSWIAEGDEPWVLLSTESDRSLQKLIMQFISEEDTITQNLEGIDVFGGPIFVHPEAKISTSVRMEGPIYIEDGAEIRHGAYLRPGTYISSGCIVGHTSEIKNTLMLPGSKAPHFNYVGDSIIGCEVNLGAGVKISNVRFDRRTVPIQLPNMKKLDSGLTKLGAMIGDSSEIGCNVVTNPGAIIPTSSAVPPNTVVTGYWNNSS